MLDRMAIIMSLLLEDPTCLDCLVHRSGLLRADVQLALARIAKALDVQREAGRCRNCHAVKRVWSLERPLTVAAEAATPTGRHVSAAARYTPSAMPPMITALIAHLKSRPVTRRP
jgi:hypothetical protein